MHSVVIALIGAFPPTLAVVVTFKRTRRKQDAIHVDVNGNVQRLLDHIDDLTAENIALRKKREDK